MKPALDNLSLILALLLVAGLAHQIPVHFDGRLPQRPGDDVLQLVLGDTRRGLSQALLQQVDVYYHGGVKVTDACSIGEHAAHDHASQPHDHLEGHEAVVAGRMIAPWQWVNRHIHAQEHRHLAETDYAELLPWVWAACRASPNNIQAYQIGAYVLSRQSGSAEPAIRLLKQGLEANPGNAELAFELGENYLNKLKQPTEAERWFLQAYANNPLDAAPGDEDAHILKLRTLHYLGYLANQRGDTARVRALLTEAEALNPAHQATRALRAILAEIESDEP